MQGLVNNRNFQFAAMLRDVKLHVTMIVRKLGGKKKRK